MATEEGEEGQCREKVGLKRKLTGPPRLLLGKKSKNQAENRSEARAKRNKRETVNDGPHEVSTAEQPNGGAEEKESPFGPQGHWKGAHKTIEEVTSKTQTEDSSVRSISEAVDTTECHDRRPGKGKKRCWKRYFSPAVICVRKQRRNSSKTSSGDCGQSAKTAPPSGQTEIPTLSGGQQTVEDPGSPNNEAQDAPDKEKITKGKKRFTIRTWPTFKRFLTSSNIRQRPDDQAHVVEELSEGGRQPSTTFRKKLQSFLNRGRTVGLPVRPKEETESTKVPADKDVEFQPTVGVNTEDQIDTDAQMDDLPGDLDQDIEQCTEVVTVTAEMSPQSPKGRVLSEEMHRDSLQNLDSTEEQILLDTGVIEEQPNDPEKGSDMVKTDSNREINGDMACTTDEELNQVVDEAHRVKVDDLNNVLSSENDEIIESDTEINYTTNVAMGTNCHLPIQVVTAKEAPEDACNEDETHDLATAETSQDDLLLTNGTADGNSNLEWLPCTNSSSAAPKADGLHVDGIGLEDEAWESSFSVDENQLVQTAYNLVQAALSAAMEQLSREQEITTTSVHREVKGCRDHA